MTGSTNKGPLAGLRVLDLSRILAGPSCTQLLGDLGADVIKIERPGVGDDTRGWGPPFAAGAPGETGMSAYFMSANRNKRSLAIDLGTPEGVRLVQKLAGSCDVLVENFKLGTLAQKQLGYEQLSAIHPSLVYCSITGFGQTGPRASEPGYDALAQALGGIMSLTGEPDGTPMKVGVGVSDLMCGMYAAVAILAALRHRTLSGVGQHIDLALYDSQLAWLANAAVDYFVSGRAPERRGNAHPHIVPYDVFPTADGHVMLAVGNDTQFSRFAHVAGAAEWAIDPRFAKNSARLQHRAELCASISARMRLQTSAFWVEQLGAVSVPCGPVRSLPEVFADPHTEARAMRVRMPHDGLADHHVDLLGNPLKLSATEVSYRLPPPALGAHTDQVLRELLDLDDVALAELRAVGAIG